MGMVATMLVMMGILAMTLIGTIATSTSKSYGGLMSLTGNAVQASSARVTSAASFNMAESGIQMTLSWLSSLSGPPANTSSFAPPTMWGATMVGNPARAQVIPDPSDRGSYFSVRIYPDSYNNDLTSSTSTQKKFLIESVGVSGGITTVVQAYVKQVSLSQYLVLLNSWNNSNNFWVSGLTTFDGPVHDNNANGVAENVLWKSAAGSPPLFTYTGSDAYTVSSPDRGFVVEGLEPKHGPPGCEQRGRVADRPVAERGGGRGVHGPHGHARRALPDVQQRPEERGGRQHSPSKSHRRHALPRRGGLHRGERG